MPVSGFMDTRSTPDEVPFGGYRIALNIEVAHKKRLCRMSGWRKLGYGNSPYNNEDLHDQGSYSDGTVNFIFRASPNHGLTKLFAGAAARLYGRDNSTGNWDVLYAGTDPSFATGAVSQSVWTAGYVGETVVFSNNLTDPLYHVIDQPDEDDGSKVSIISDLQFLNVTRAGLVFSYRDFVFLCNVVQDGQRMSNRIIWSDYRRPLSYIPKKDVSLAGYADLPSGEYILGAAPMLDAMLIYTTKSIYELRIVASAEAVSITPRYTASESGARCLAYPRTLVTTGQDHFYCSIDGIYRYNFYTPEPELVEYIHRASSLVFDSIDTSNCMGPCAGFNPIKRQVWLSWLETGQTLPTQTLVIGTEFPFTSLVDHGFTAFCNDSPRTLKSVVDVLRELCICTWAELDTYGTDDWGAKYCYGLPDDEVCGDRPLNFYTATGKIFDTVYAEDHTQAAADATSLCAQLGDMTLTEFCETETNAVQACNTNQPFIMVSAEDNCLKEAVPTVFYRETCTDNAGCGAYTGYGYKSRMLSGANSLNVPGDFKLFSMFGCEAHPEDAVIPAIMTLKVGRAAQAVDPRDPPLYGNLVWEDQDAVELRYQDDETGAQNTRKGVQSDGTISWPLHWPALYFYYDLLIENPNSTPIDVGGAVCFSRFGFNADKTGRCY